jgi:fructoselysine 6-kinase
MMSRSGTAIACVGDNCVDAYLPPVSRRFAAGNAVNVAVALRLAGHAADYFGAVGDDADGAGVVAALAGAGVGVEHVQVLPGATSLTEISLEAGERVFSRFAEGAAERYAPRVEEIADLAGRPLVHAANLADRGALLAPLQEAGTRVTYDCDDQRDPAVASGLEVAFFSLFDDEPLAAAYDLAGAAATAGAHAAVVMCGARGSVGCDGRRTIHVAAQPVEPLDTCGAGDSFIAAFIVARLAGDCLDDCLHAGTAAGASACRRYGVLPLDDSSLVRSLSLRPSPSRRSS